MEKVSMKAFYGDVIVIDNTSYSNYKLSIIPKNMYIKGGERVRIKIDSWNPRSHV
jgi:hypothetical protein